MHFNLIFLLRKGKIFKKLIIKFKKLSLKILGSFSFLHFPTLFFDNIHMKLAIHFSRLKLFVPVEISLAAQVGTSTTPSENYFRNSMNFYNQNESQ
jgi:hypothetical protein